MGSLTHTRALLTLPWLWGLGAPAQAQPHLGLVPSPG